MPCEHYKDALIEVAASGATPQGELRAHFSKCASCRAAFDEEQSLFAAIDSGLHATANSNVTPSLLPRVRAGLDGVTTAYSGWSSRWFVLAGAAVAAAAFFLVVTARYDNPRPARANSAANRTPAPQILPSAQEASHSALSKKGDSVPRPSISAARNTQSADLASHKPTPEILVPRDQEILLASYAKQWDSRKHPPLVAGEVDQRVAALLEISPIQITELDVKPLAEGDSQ